MFVAAEEFESREPVVYNLPSGRTRASAARILRKSAAWPKHGTSRKPRDEKKHPQTAANGRNDE